jgi:hypothetical protein
MSRPGIPWRRALAAALAVVIGGSVGTAWAAFSSSTSNGPNSFSAISDATGPTISRAVAAKSSGATPGTIRQGGDYYVYAEVSDESGVQTVTVNTSTFDTGVTAASLASAGGPWTVGGQSYDYRSAVLTANTPLVTGSNYTFSVSATDVLGNPSGPTSYLVTIETYVGVIAATSGILSHWRLGDGAISADELDDSAGKELSSHSGQLNAAWTLWPGEARTAVISNENRLRMNGTATGGTLYYTSATPSSANYLVEADVHVKSLLATDSIAVVGRMNISDPNDTFYMARYIRDSSAWQLFRVVNGVGAQLGLGFSQTLTAGQTYRLGLEINGSTIRLLVDGVERVTTIDALIAAAGRGGVRLGTSGTTATTTNTAGLHLDNFRITSLTTTASDSNGTNHGTYFNGVRLNQPGALVGTTNRSTVFDGVNDYVSVARQISNDFSIEGWFKSTQGIGTGTQWWSGAGLVDAETSSNFYDFGVSLRSDGRVVAGVGHTPDVSIVSTSGGFNNGAWHHFVFTRTRSTGALNLYVDGQAQGSATGSTASLIDTPNINFGRIQSGTNYYAGSLDDIGVYTSVLTPAQVLDHYRAGTGTG